MSSRAQAIVQYGLDIPVSEALGLGEPRFGVDGPSAPSGGVHGPSTPSDPGLADRGDWGGGGWGRRGFWGLDGQMRETAV